MNFFFWAFLFVFGYTIFGTGGIYKIVGLFKKTGFLVFLVILACITGSCVMFVPGDDGEYIWNPFDYAVITDVGYTAVLIDDPELGGGLLHITERLTFDIHAFSKNNLYWELWRDLPESITDGVHVFYEVNSVRQIFGDGTYLEYGQSPKLYWYDNDYIDTAGGLGPGKWYHSEGPYDPDMRRYECVLFYVDGLYRESVTFEIEYVMYNAALRYSDMSELYVSLFSGDAVRHLNSFKGQFLIPDGKMPREGNYDAYTYGTNSHEFPFEVSSARNPGYTTFSFELDSSLLRFRPVNRYIEFALISYNEDKHIFTEYASFNTNFNNDMLGQTRKAQADYEAIPARWNTAGIAVLIISLVFACFAARYVLTADKRMNRKWRFYAPASQPLYFRDIPSAPGGDVALDPVFAAALTFCRGKKPKTEDGYAAVMLSLVRKGYIDTEQIRSDRGWDNNNVKITVKYRPTQQDLYNFDQIAQQFEPLTETEMHYFNLIARHSKGTEITLDALQNRITSDYDYTNAFVKNMESAAAKIGTSQGYYQTNDIFKPGNSIKSSATAFLLLGIASITLANFISYGTWLGFAFGSFFILGAALLTGAVMLYRMSGRYRLLTQFGEDEYAKWHALYNFLNSETLMSERTVIELPIWEQYLVYATAFGISEKVTKALEVRCPQTVINSSPMLRNPYYRSRYFYVSSRSFRSAAGSASFAARSAGYSGGSGGYGGYGGGGRGGGGGGGGH